MKPFLLLLHCPQQLSHLSLMNVSFWCKSSRLLTKRLFTELFERCWSLSFQTISHSLKFRTRSKDLKEKTLQNTASMVIEQWSKTKTNCCIFFDSDPMKCRCFPQWSNCWKCWGSWVWNASPNQMNVWQKDLKSVLYFFGNILSIGTFGYWLWDLFINLVWYLDQCLPSYMYGTWCFIPALHSTTSKNKFHLIHI